jgi:hypothetical protein
VILMSVAKRDDRAHSFSGSGNSNLGCAYPPPRRVGHSRWLYSAGQRRATFGAKQRAIGTERRNWLNAIAFNFWLARAIEPNEVAAPLWAFGEP